MTGAATTISRNAFAKTGLCARTAACILAVAGTLSLATPARAQPIELKLSFFTSDRSIIYQCQIKPFVDAVNADGADLVRIKVYFSGAISSVQLEQPELVREGIADVANVAPGYSPQLFPDTSVLELPGLFRDEKEASLVFTRLVEAGVLEGYKDFFVAGAYVSTGESIHSRKPIASLAGLKGQKIRVNNEIEAMTLRGFGAIPLLLPLNQTMDALSKGDIDGVTIPPAMLFEFGYGRLTGHHYMLRLCGAPVTLLMNHKKLMTLPPLAQEVIRKYSGEWLAKQETACFAAKNPEVISRLNADARRSVVEPSAADLAAAQRVFASVIEKWAAQSLRHRELLALVKSEIAKLRPPNEVRP